MKWRLVSVFLLGVSVAIWLVPILTGPVVQRLSLERDEYRNKAESLEAQLKQLKAAENKAGPVVQRIKVQVEGLDHRVVLEAERRIHKLLTQQYVGRRLDDVSPFLVVRRVQGSLMEIDGVQYQLDVELLAVGPELALYGVLEAVKGP